MNKKWVIKIEVEQVGSGLGNNEETSAGNCPNILRLNTDGLKRFMTLCDTMAQPDMGRNDACGTTDFFIFAKAETRRLREANRLTTAANYKTAIRSLQAYHGGMALPFGQLDCELLEGYQRWLVGRGVCRNSVSNYMRVLRAIYNKGVRKGLTVQRRPFSEVFTGIEPTRKRAIGTAELKRLSLMDLVAGSELALVRDIFLFSFFTRGMPFIDIAFLRPEQIDHGTLTYIRRKTGRTFRVKLESCCLELLDRYAHPGARYVFPILTSTDARTAMREYRSKACYHNRLLKQLSERAGLKTPLSFYVARHTWASTAFRSGVDMETISRAMGHSSTRITHVYIKNIDDDMGVNKANSIVLRHLWK